MATIVDGCRVDNYKWTLADYHVGFHIFKTSMTAAFSCDVTFPHSLSTPLNARYSNAFLYHLGFLMRSEPWVKMCL